MIALNTIPLASPPKLTWLVYSVLYMPIIKTEVIRNSEADQGENTVLPLSQFCGLNTACTGVLKVMLLVRMPR